MVDFMQDALDRKMEIIEAKLRNSFQAIKFDNDEMKKRIDELSSNLKNNTFSKDLTELNKRIEKNESNFNKFKKDISRDSLKKEIVKEVMPLFNEKIDTGLKLVKLENKELVKELEDFKKKWAEANEEKLNAGLEEMRANFAKLDKKAIANMNDIKSSTLKSISDQNKLIDQYSAKIEDYSNELEVEYSKSKKEIVSSVERKINAYRTETNEEIAKLRGQIAYLKGKINKELTIEDKKEIQSKSVPETKEAKKNKTLFNNLISLLAGESPEVKIESKKKPKVEEKPTTRVGATAGQKKLENKGEKGFFDSIVKSLSDE